MSNTLFDYKLLHHYITDHSCNNIATLIQEMYNQSMLDSKAQYNTPIAQLNLIYMLCKISNPQKILEIGVFRGLASVTMSLASSDNASLTLIDITDKYLLDYKKYWDKSCLNKKATLKIGRAIDILDKMLKLETETYDFSYIDANKSDYLRYYELVFQLTKPGGIILIDNVLWKGQVVTQEKENTITRSIQKMNFRIKNDNRVESVILPLEDGIYFIRKIS